MSATIESVSMGVVLLLTPMRPTVHQESPVARVAAKARPTHVAVLSNAISDFGKICVYNFFPRYLASSDSF